MDEAGMHEAGMDEVDMRKANMREAAARSAVNGRRPLDSDRSRSNNQANRT
jgi:hypothetical protein